MTRVPSTLKGGNQPPSNRLAHAASGSAAPPGARRAATGRGAGHESALASGSPRRSVAEGRPDDPEPATEVAGVDQPVVADEHAPDLGERLARRDELGDHLDVRDRIQVERDDSVRIPG